MTDFAPVFYVEVVATGLEWGEGPAWLPSADGVVFSDIGNDALLLWRNNGVSTFRRPSGRANGNTVDREGRLVSCEHTTRRITRTEPDGTITVLADAFEGGRLNSPNDVIVASDGTVWFTDPPYGLLRGDAPPGSEQEQPGGAVYRVDPSTGAVDRIIDFMDKPNGLALSLDETRLFVADTGHSHRKPGNHHIFVFDLVDGRPTNMTVFANLQPGACDGLRIDADGNVWSTAGDGIRCYAPDGTETSSLPLGEMTTNLCFLPSRVGHGMFVTTPTRALVCRLTMPAPTPDWCRDPRHQR
jgi:gluconolactonase